jgi:cytoskeleton protein RodZ
LGVIPDGYEMSGVAQDETTPTGTPDDGVPMAGAAPVPDPNDTPQIDLETAPGRAHLRLVADNSDSRPQTSGAVETERMDNADPHDETLGQRSGALLRSTRENRGYSIEQVSKETRIRQDHLRAIEDMMPNLVGAKVYVEGHIRTYARHLGLPAETVLSQYRRECAILSDPEKLEMAPPAAPRRLRPSAPVLGLLVVALAGAGVAAVLLNLPEPDTSRTANTTETADPVAAAPAVTAPPLRIVAVRQARIEIRGADGTKFIGREFQPGETYAPRVGAGWTVSTDQGDAFEWRLGDTMTLGLFAPQGGPVNYQSVDMALKRQPVALNPAAMPETTPSPTDANAVVTSGGAPGSTAPAAPRRPTPRPAQQDNGTATSSAPTPVAIPDPALAAYPDAAPASAPDPAPAPETPPLAQ